MTNAYLRNNSNNKKFILTQFKDHQKNRLQNITTRQSLSNRIQRKAQNKRIGLSPQMKLLVDAIGEEIETDLNDTILQEDTTDHVLTVYDLPEDHVTDEFHDTNDMNTDILQE